MLSVVAAFVMAMLVTAIATPFVRRAAVAVGAVDEPGARRVHTRRVPRLGGIAIAIGFFLPLLTLFAIRTQAALIFFSTGGITIGLVAGSLLVVMAGLVDDLKGMGAKAKLLIQTAAAAIAFAGGMRIEGLDLPGIGALNLGWFALPATILWIVGIVNAMNLIDGLDGLAAGVAFFACLTNFVIASMTGNVYILLVSASLGGAVVGFLFYNFNPAKIFMGDSGSMFLGFVLGSASLLGAGTQKSPTLIAIVVPILALGLPILDMLMTIARRFLERRSLFAADRGHIHHRLLDSGLTHRRSVLSLYLVSIAFTIVALIAYVGRSWQVGFALFALTAVLIAVVRFVGYFSSTIASGGTLGEKALEPLRLAVFRVLRQMATASSPEHLPALLADFGTASGLLAIRIVNPKNLRLNRWGWESPETEGQPPREAICTKFDLSDGHDTLELQFFVDVAAGAVSPQARILFRLVADGAEAIFALPREAARAPASSHVDRLAQGGE
jgi:UDP-GlcNAc:undecaprenyl-phosphate/decaprenyl-phosphate GlcNAc-1-phosphate transferase